MKTTSILLALAVVALCLMLGCSGGSRQDAEATQQTPVEAPISIPPFNADSAYAYIAKQTAFGPRVPGTPAHRACADWLVNFLKAQGAEVTVQEATVKDHNGKDLPIRNIIAAFNPQVTRRIILSAHWDTRPRADEDTHRQDEPIEGANDGGSGVGVLLELARLFKQQPPTLGVDICLWDAEDGGVSSISESWCLGAQHWAKHPHQAGYRAEWGINLDMVGAAGATFPMEEHSLRFAPQYVDRVWQTASRLGHGAYFRFMKHGAITDDHYFINTLAHIPMLDIIHIDLAQSGGFFPHWHTHEDTMDKIDRATLNAVGQTVLDVVLRAK